MHDYISRYPYLVLALSGGICGVLFSLGFAPVSFSPAAFAGAVLLTALISHLGSARRAAWTSWFFGLGWFCPGLAWTTESMAVHGRLPWPLAWLGLLLLGAVCALFVAVAAYAARRLVKTPGAFPFAFAALWCLSEWVRAEVFPLFGWLAPGYAFMETRFLGWAPLAGIDGVTLASLLCTAATAVLLLQPGWRRFFLTVFILCFFAGWGEFGLSHNWSRPGPTLHVRMAQPALPVADAWTRTTPAERINALLPLAVGSWPDDSRPRLFLTPEGIVNQPVSRLDQASVEALVTLQNRAGAPLLFNGFRSDARGFFNTAFLLENARIVWSLDKRLLVPFGEFVPAGARWFVDLLGIPLADLKPGTLGQPLLELGDVSAGLLICYENLSGSVVRSMFSGSESPEILVVTANLGWFAAEVIPQHLDMTRMRALEASRPAVSVSNDGLSALVNEKGRVVETMRASGTDSRTFTVTGTTGAATPYVRFGAIGALLAALMILFAAILYARSGLKTARRA